MILRILEPSKRIPGRYESPPNINVVIAYLGFRFVLVYLLLLSILSSRLSLEHCVLFFLSGQQYFLYLHLYLYLYLE